VLTVDGAQLAQLGEIHPDVAEKFDIEARVYVAEIDLDALRPLEKAFYGVKPLPKFPAVTRDIALVMDEKVGVGTVLETIQASGGKNLESVKLFDIYRGVGVPEGKKSMAFSLELRADDRTLTDADSEGVMSKVLSALSEKLGATLR
jgi:phenylalanyl-tRNA synthetase beta chain